MTIEKIIEECMARKKAEPGKTRAQIAGDVMDEIAEFKTALGQRPEFGSLVGFEEMARAVAPAEAAPKQ